VIEGATAHDIGGAAVSIMIGDCTRTVVLTGPWSWLGPGPGWALVLAGPWSWLGPGPGWAITLTGPSPWLGPILWGPVRTGARSGRGPSQDQGPLGTGAWPLHILDTVTLWWHWHGPVSGWGPFWTDPIQAGARCWQMRGIRSIPGNRYRCNNVVKNQVGIFRFSNVATTSW